MALLYAMQGPSAKAEILLWCAAKRFSRL